MNETGAAKFSREYWLVRAQEIRIIAELECNPDAKQKMFRVANSYIWLADQAAEKAALPLLPSIEPHQ